MDNSTKSDAPAEPIALTAGQVEKASGDNGFAFKIFKEVSKLNGSNTFFSPLSLNAALGMLYNGASGETRAEMAEALGMTDFTDTEINEYYQKMLQALLKIDPNTDIGIANSIWYRTRLPVKQSFIDVNRNFFEAEVKPLDFNSSDAANVINKWCADKTNNRIKEIIESTSSDDMMYLINALYFKSKWQFKFDKNQSKQDDFTKIDNQKVKVNMMEQTTTLSYYADQRLQCVEMPCGNQAFGMIVVLPVNETDINRLIENLDDVAWQKIVDNLWKENVRVKLPRFKIECDFDLKDPVRNVGIQKIFSGGLENISDLDLLVSKIKQKTFIEVNEEGAEAAAVTAIGITLGSGTGGGVSPIVPIQFFVNRPFLYLIKEKSTGVILFIGRMDEPKE